MRTRDDILAYETPNVHRHMKGSDADDYYLLCPKAPTPLSASSRDVRPPSPLPTGPWSASCAQGVADQALPIQPDQVAVGGGASAHGDAQDAVARLAREVALAREDVFQDEPPDLAGENGHRSSPEGHGIHQSRRHHAGRVMPKKSKPSLPICVRPLPPPPTEPRSGPRDRRRGRICSRPGNGANGEEDAHQGGSRELEEEEAAPHPP